MTRDQEIRKLVKQAKKNAILACIFVVISITSSIAVIILGAIK